MSRQTIQIATATPENTDATPIAKALSLTKLSPEQQSLVTSNLGLARYFGRGDEDATAAAYYGLCVAVTNYDESRSSFGTYARLHIRTEIARDRRRYVGHGCGDAIDGAPAAEPQGRDDFASLGHALAWLSFTHPDDHDLIVARFGLDDRDPHTESDLCVTLGLTRQQVRTRLAKALDRLRRAFTAN